VTQLSLFLLCCVFDIALFGSSDATITFSSL